MNKTLIGILQQILPKSISNKYYGKRLALIVFFFITFVTISRSLAHILLNDGGAGSIAGIPLEDYSQNASETIVLMFGLWGLSQILMGVIYLIVCIRYRSLVPLMYLFIIAEYSFRIILVQLNPIVTNHTAPGAIGNYIIIPVAILMFFLSIRIHSENKPD